MYLLDTNVISELRRTRPHGAVVAWLEGVADEDLYLSAVTLGELQAGVEVTRKQDPDRASEIEEWVDQVAQTVAGGPRSVLLYTPLSVVVAGLHVNLRSEGRVPQPPSRDIITW